MFHLENMLLCGSAQTYADMKACVEKAQVWARANAGKKGAELEIPKLYNLMGDVGVISIKGNLYSGSTGWMAAFGLVGYEDIQAALFEGLRDKKAKRLMLDVQSNGGQVKGVNALAETLRNAREVKPLNAYIDTALSAGYWLASAASHLIVDEVGETGSIGTVTVHTDLTKMYEKEGIVKTVMRAGENKMLANPYEPLSDKAKEHTQAMLNRSRDMFTNTVAMNRGVTAATVESQFGQGLHFLGQDGVKAGLADAVGSFQEALAYKG